MRINPSPVAISVANEQLVGSGLMPSLVPPLNSIRLAFVLSFASILLTNLVFPIHWGSVDEVAYASLLSGVGWALKPDYHILYSNVFWTYPILSLYKILPHVPWYALCQCVVALVALTTIGSVFINRFEVKKGVLLFALFYISCGAFLISNLQFTSTAALVSQAGFILFLHVALKEKFQPRSILFAACLVVLGSLIRFKSFELTLMLSGSFAVAVSICRRDSIDRRLKECAWFFLVWTAATFCEFSNNQIYSSDPVWHEGKQFAALTGAVHDYRVLDCNSSGRTEIAKIFSLNDVKLLKQYVCADFSTESVKRAIDAAAAAGRRYTPAPRLPKVIGYLFALLILSACLSPIVSTGTIGRKQFASWICGNIALVFYLTYWMWLPPRVFAAILLCSTSLTLLSVDPAKLGRLLQWVLLPNKQRRLIVAIATTVFGALAFPLIRDVLWLPSMRACENDRRLTHTFASLRTDSPRLFLYWTPLNYEDVSPWADLPKRFENLHFYVPSNFSKTPIGLSMLREHGYDNFLDALISPDFYIIGDPKLLTLLSKFVAEHRSENVSFVLVFKDPSTHFCVWKPVRQPR